MSGWQTRDPSQVGITSAGGNVSSIDFVDAAGEVWTVTVGTDGQLQVAGAVANPGAITQQVGPLSQSLSGTSVAANGIVQVLPAVTTAASGTVTAPVFTGDVAQTLAAVTQALSPPAAAYDDEVLADSPLAYWKLDETSGTTAADEQATHPGDYEGTFTLAGTALVTDGGNALSLAGAGRMRVPHHVDFNFPNSADGDTTIEMWVEVDDPTTNALHVFGDKTGLSSGGNQWGIWYDNRSSQGSPRRLRFLMRNGQVDWAGDTTRDALGAGGHLVVCIRSGVMEIWWNGDLKATQADNPPAGSNSQNPTFGQSTDGSFGLSGRLDNIAFYKGTALTEARIQAHYNAGTA